MDQRNFFQLAMRIAGLIVCLYGLEYFREYAAVQMGYWSLERTSPVLYFGSGAAFVIVGLYLLRGAPHFMRYAFPEDDTHSSDNGPESVSEDH